jgi:outer membrane protein OmpA-like peptidoglycan-associated protein
MTRLLLPVAVALLAGCAQVRERVVLLPDPDGRPAALVVKSAAAQTELTEPYAAAELRGDRLEARTLDPDEVRRRYAAVLAAQPPRPRSHTLYFEHDKGGLTARSAAELDRIKAELAANPAAEVVITGHTDRVGKLEFNDRLSLDRAEAVRAILLGIGIPGSAMSLAGRGEREPAVPTEDEVAEPRNRRVEIKIR